MLNLDPHTQNTAMIVVTAIVIAVELLGLYFFVFTGKNSRIKRFIGKGGIATAHLLQADEKEGRYLCRYSHTFQDKEYTFVLLLKQQHEKITVFFDPLNPAKVETNVEDNFFMRYIGSVLPALAITFLLIAYKVIYG